MADPTDPRWLDHSRWDEVIVEAESSGTAVATAARDLGPGGRHVGNESSPERSGFEDVKLYRVTRIGNGERIPSASAPRIVRAVRNGVAVDPGSVD
ncbi:MAG: hypothetical protein WD767_03875 [Alphaproteobacteria bacterium]